MLGELLNWWARQMADLVAPIADRFAAPTPDALLVARDQFDPDTIHLLRRRKGRVAPVVVVPADGTPDVWRPALAARRRGEAVVLSLTTPLLPRRAALPM